jgi:predicted DCC family thiol-disulfide oxidoreductase YuxK
MAAKPAPCQLAGVKWVLFFDGDCAFCAKSVNRVFDLDHRGVIDFSPLQGELAKKHDLTQHADLKNGTMVVLRESDGAIFLRSDAVIELSRALGGWRRIGELGRVVPRFIRDGIYKCIARNRHLFTRKGDACRMPTPEFLARMRQ